MIAVPSSGKDHLGWAQWWGAETASAIRRAVAVPNPKTSVDLDLEYAVRAARIATWHFWKARGVPKEAKCST